VLPGRGVMTTVDIGYAWGQLMQARATAAEHPDADVRGRAQTSVAKWEAVIAGVSSGSLQVGSRTPTTAPAWVTLDVVTGGFATGGYAAGGEMREHERALAAQLGIPVSRRALNLHYLESPDTTAMLESGAYRIDVPEESALLVIAWLRARGELERARELVETIAPWFETLRFYPIPADRPVEVQSAVRLQDLGQTFDNLAKPRRQHRFETMREAVLVWTPLRDRALELVAYEGGDRIARVMALAEDLARAGTPRTARAIETAKLIGQLVDPTADRAKLRNTLARHVSAHGTPGTPQYRARRAAELRAVLAPLHADLRRVLLDRLRGLRRDGGVDLADATAPVRDGEAAGMSVGAALPAYLVAKVARSWDAPLAALVERGVIPSSEVLARVLPQVTAHVRTQAFDDAAVQRLYGATYLAFRRRRGLLLLNYAHQVRVEELPWIAAIEGMRRPDAGATAAAREIVSHTSSLAIRAFPYTITPNKLVTELASLSAAAALKLPLCEELAADIFMGSFTAKFVEAARIAARLLTNTLYARYYGIDTTDLVRLPVPTGRTSGELAELCARRAAAVGSGYGVARNGKIIEQAQILTTHNLAVLFDQLAPREALRPLAEQCLRWIVQQLRIPTRDGHATLIRLKNAAYAWRQMMFYLSFVDDVDDFVRWSRDRVAKAGAAFEQRFTPALRGLELAAAGVPSTAPAFAEHGGRVFTGWSTERHWLSPKPGASAA